MKDKKSKIERFEVDWDDLEDLGAFEETALSSEDVEREEAEEGHEGE